MLLTRETSIFLPGQLAVDGDLDTTVRLMLLIGDGIGEPRIA